MTGWWWIAAALAQDPAVVPAVTPDPAGVIDPGLAPLAPEAAALAPASPETLLEEAWRRIDHADYAGARIVAEQVLDKPAYRARAIAAIGAAFELDGEPAEALPRYKEALETDTTGELAPHMHLRMAESLGALGRTDEALAELALLGDPAAMPRLDQVKLELIRGILLLQGGERKAGRKQLAKTLGGAGSDEVTFYQAKARAQLARDLAAEAAALPLAGSQRKQVKNLEARTALIRGAEEQVVAAVGLREPEWTLEGLLVLGEAYEQVGDDLRVLPAPPKLATAEGRQLFDQVLHERVSTIWVKAANHYEQGVAVATTLSWSGKRVDRLTEHLAAVEAKVEAYDASLPPPLPR